MYIFDKLWDLLTFLLLRRKKKRRRNTDSAGDLDAEAEAASVSLYPEYCQRSNEEDAFLEIAQDFGDLISPQEAETGEQHKLPPPPPGFQVSLCVQSPKKVFPYKLCEYAIE